MKVYRVWSLRSDAVVFAESPEEATAKAVQSGEIADWEVYWHGDPIAQEVPLPDGWQLRYTKGPLPDIDRPIPPKPPPASASPMEKDYFTLGYTFSPRPRSSQRSPERRPMEGMGSLSGKVGRLCRWIIGLVRGTKKTGTRRSP
jgi:hypothetical protein